MIAPLAAAASIAAAHAAGPAAPPALLALLRARDQALLDAFAPGDRGVWERTLTPDAVYVDENGVAMSRQAFLAQLEPLPAGTSGQIAIVDYDVRLDGDTALVIHGDDEREDYHGQALRAAYLMSETWLRRDSGWRLAQVHAYVANKDPPAVGLPASTLDGYVGRYLGGKDLTYGGVSQPLLAEAADVFFVAGQPRTRKIFRRDAAGKVLGFVDRREGVDVVWTRAPTSGN